MRRNFLLFFFLLAGLNVHLFSQSAVAAVENETLLKTNQKFPVQLNVDKIDKQILQKSKTITLPYLSGEHEFELRAFSIYGNTLSH